MWGNTGWSGGKKHCLERGEETAWNGKNTAWDGGNEGNCLG